MDCDRLGVGGGGGGKPTPLLLTHIEENGLWNWYEVSAYKPSHWANHIHPMKMPIN